MKRNIILSLFMILCANIFAQNINFYTDEMSIVSGESKSLAIRMKTDIEIYGFQFDLTLPEGISIAESKKPIKASDWISDTHTISCEEQEDGSMRVMCVSLDADVIIPGEDDIVYIDLVAKNDLESGQYTAALTGIIASKGDDKKIELEDYNFVITGVGKTKEVGFQIDKVEIHPEGSKTIAVNLNSDFEIAGFQFDLEVPKGITVMTKDNTSEKSERPRMIERGEYHQVSTNLLENGFTRFLVSSLTDDIIEPGNGPVMEITLKAAKDAVLGDYKPMICNIVVSQGDLSKIKLDDTPYDLSIVKPTGIEGVDAAANENSPMYNLAGQRVSRVQKGIFIQNGKKVLK